MNAYLYNSHDIPLILTIGQSLLFALILLLTRGRAGTGNGILALLLLSFGLYALDTLTFWSESLRPLLGANLGLWVFWVFEWVAMAQGPLVYAYVRVRLTGRDLSWREEYPHLFPIGLFIFAEIMILLSMGHERLYGGITDWRLWIDYDLSKMLDWAKRISALAYGFLAWHYLMKAEGDLQGVYSDPSMAEPRWLRIVVGGFLALWIWTTLFPIVAILGAHAIASFMGLTFNYFVYVFISSLLFFGLMHSHLVARLPEEEPAPRPLSEDNLVAGGDFQQRSADQLNQLLMKQALYLNPELTLAQLASAANMPERQASELINTHLGKNFFELVNRARVDKAKQLLASTDLPVQQVLDNSGFNSKATFNRLFKRYAQMTPSEFRQHASAEVAAEL